MQKDLAHSVRKTLPVLAKATFSLIFEHAEKTYHIGSYVLNY